MGFVPPLNLGGFQPSPATLAQWVYQIWQYLQENPIATQEQIQEFIGTFITTSPETQAMIGAGVEEYLTENPPAAPVQSVQGKTGAVQLAYNEIVPPSNAVPVYKASSTPSTNTLVGQYNIGYRLFVNTATQEIFTISPAGALSLVGRGKFDGTTIDLNSADGDTTINEAINDISSDIDRIDVSISSLHDNYTAKSVEGVAVDVFGWVTNGGNQLSFVVPINRVIPEGATFTITSITTSLRTVGGGYAPSASYQVNMATEFGNAYISQSGLRITLNRASGGWSSTAPNNTVVAGPVVITYIIS